MSEPGVPDSPQEQPAGPQDGLVVREARAPGSLLLASTIDGTIHALDRETGRPVWSCSDLGGSLLKGTTTTLDSLSGEQEAWGLSRDPLFIMEPLFPGSLYVYVPGDIIQVAGLVPGLC